MTNMAENTKIEWADATVNHWAGCTKVSPACDNCYAERMAGRLWKVQWGAGQPRRQFVSAREMLEALDRKAQRIGKKLRVFHNSLSDMFDNEVPDGWRMDAFKIMADTPNLQHLVLTKRIGNVRHYTQHDGLAFDLMGDGRVWIGATIVNQEEADRDIPKLLDVPARVRFLSMEPLLGPVDLRALQYGEGEIDALKPYQWEAVIAAWRDTTPEWVENFEDWFGVTLNDGLSGPMHAALDWVIVGGESGPGARPMPPAWVRSIRDQCAAAGVPFLFKQWGNWRAAAGRVLGGRTHDGFPATQDAKERGE